MQLKDADKRAGLFARWRCCQDVCGVLECESEATWLQQPLTVRRTSVFVTMMPLAKITAQGLVIA